MHLFIKIMKKAKKVLLWCATPDAVLRLGLTPLASDKDELIDIYFRLQEHESLPQFLQNNAKTCTNMHIQVFYVNLSSTKLFLR